MTLEQLLHSIDDYIYEIIYYHRDNFIRIENQEWLQLNIGFVILWIVLALGFLDCIYANIQEHEYRVRLRKSHQEDMARERERKNQNG